MNYEVNQTCCSSEILKYMQTILLGLRSGTKRNGCEKVKFTRQLVLMSSTKSSCMQISRGGKAGTIIYYGKKLQYEQDIAGSSIQTN
jgi:hypothetical protein